MSTEKCKLFPFVEGFNGVKNTALAWGKEVIIRPKLPKSSRFCLRPAGLTESALLSAQGRIFINDLEVSVKLFEVAQHGACEGMARSFWQTLLENAKACCTWSEMSTKSE